MCLHPEHDPAYDPVGDGDGAQGAPLQISRPKQLDTDAPEQDVKSKNGVVNDVPSAPAHTALRMTPQDCVAPWHDDAQDPVADGALAQSWNTFALIRASSSPGVTTSNPRDPRACTALTTLETLRDHTCISTRRDTAQ